MKNFPRKLDSKTTNLRITVPENLDLALEGLIRKVLKEQPKTDDIYSFAADYFETLLKIRDKAGAKYMSSQICSFHNDEDAHEMIKLANSFPKPRTASDEGKSGHGSGKSLPVRKSPVIRKPEKVSIGSRMMGDKRKRPVERIKSTTNARNKTVAGFVKPVAEGVTKPSTEEPKVKDEKEDKLLTDLKSKLQDIDEDEELLTSDPIKELVERELMSKTQSDITRNKDQSSTDVPEEENLESEKAVDKVSDVVEPHENDQLKDELESKENREDEALIGDTTTTGDELCAVVDALSIPRAVEKKNETATNRKEENKAELNLNESEKEKTEEGEQVIETPKPEAEEAVTNESTSEKPEQVTDEMKDLKEEKPERDNMVKQDEDNEKKEVKDDEEKTKESTEVVEERKEDIKEIKDNVEDDTEDIKDKSKDAEDIKEPSTEKDETDTTTNKKEEETSSETPKVEVEDDQDKPKEGAEDTKGTSTEKEETDTTTDIKEEETPSETLKVEVKETEEAEKDPSDITQDNSNSVPDDSKKESSNEIEEKQTEGVTNQTSLPEENSSQVQTTKEEISNEKPSTDSEEPINKQEDEEIKTQVGTEEPLDTTETNDTPTTESKLEQNDEIKVETKEGVEELPKTEGTVTSLDETVAENSTAVNETQPSDKEDKNQNEKLEDKGENHSKDVVANDERLEETKEEEIKEKETEPQNEAIIKKEVEEEPAKTKPKEETKIVTAEDEKKPDETEKPISENDQQEDKPEVVVSTEEKPGGDIIENESKTEVKVKESKPIEEKPEVIDQEKSTKDKPEGAKLIEEEPKPTDQGKAEEKTEEVKLETEQVGNPEAGTEVTEIGVKPKEDKNGESEESKQVETKEEPEKEFSPGSELTADGETVDEKTVPEVEVVATEGKPKLDEEKETEKVSAQVNTKTEEEGIAVATPDQDDKDSVEHERQKRSNEDEPQATTDETKQTEERENLKDEENNRTTDNIQNNNIGGKESETNDNKIENETIETAEENKPEDTNKDKVGGEEKTETRETTTEPTAEGELCTVVDTQNPTEPDETSKETAQLEDGITIKTITTHYYDLLQVPTTVTKEFKVHRTQDASLTQHDLSNVGNTIIKSYQFVKELTSDGDSNNNNPQTDSQDIKPDIGSTNQTEDTELERDVQKDEIEDLNSIPTSGNLSELNLVTMHELFLDNERKLSSSQKGETKFSSLKNAKESLDDSKIRTESPKTPPTDEDKKEVEEIVTKTVIPRIPEAVPDPPREAEEINEETITEETDNVKDKKEDDKPDANSSDDSNEPTDSSNNGRSIDSDVPIISVEVRTVIETQILDDDDEEEEGSEGTQKGGDCRTALTLTDGSNDVNVEVEATIQVPIDTADSVNGDNKNLTDQEKVSEQQQAKQQTNKHELPEGNEIKSSNEESEAGGSSTIRDGSSGESDSTTLTAVTQIKRVDSGRKNFARSSTQDLLTTQSLDSCKRPPLLKTRSLSVFRQGATDFEIWNTIEKELEEAATKIQSKYRGYTVRKRLRREDAVQITTEESSVSTTPVEQDPNLDQDNFRTTGEFHDSIVLSIHPR